MAAAVMVVVKEEATCEGEQGHEKAAPVPKHVVCVGTGAAALHSHGSSQAMTGGRHGITSTTKVSILSVLAPRTFTCSWMRWGPRRAPLCRRTRTRNNARSSWATAASCPTARALRLGEPCLPRSMAELRPNAELVVELVGHFHVVLVSDGCPRCRSSRTRCNERTSGSCRRRC
jgi:hypothetical protein